MKDNCYNSWFMLKNWKDMIKNELDWAKFINARLFHCSQQILGLKFN